MFLSLLLLFYSTNDLIAFLKKFQFLKHVLFLTTVLGDIEFIIIIIITIMFLVRSCQLPLCLGG